MVQTIVTDQGHNAQMDEELTTRHDAVPQSVPPRGRTWS
jgi:hypothetical protein